MIPAAAMALSRKSRAAALSVASNTTLVILKLLVGVVCPSRSASSPREVEHLRLGAAVMGVSAVVNTGVSLYLLRVAKQEDSLALEADAHHLATDVYTSAGVGAGLLLVWVTGWHIVDPPVAIAVALLIARIGWPITVQASGQLMDRSLPPAEVADIEKVLRAEPAPSASTDSVRASPGATGTWTCTSCSLRRWVSARPTR
jgi:cation diffusion facilitator family transporter